MAVQKGLEQTLVLIKPDALKLSLTGYMLSQFSEFHTGLRFAGAKIVHVTRMLAEEHYAEHKGKPFYPSLIEYITGKLHYPTEPQKPPGNRPGLLRSGRGQDGPQHRRSHEPSRGQRALPGTVRALGTVVPVKDAAGNVVGERMDNLVHASASDDEAEREIKLWFKPNDIMPYMHAYPTDISDEHYYFKDGKLSTRHHPESTCLLAPGDTAWASDLDALRRLMKGEPTPCSVDAVAAKYLINERREGA